MAAPVPNQTNRNLSFFYTPESQTFGKKKITLTENHDWKIEAEGKKAEHHTLGQAMLRFCRSSEGLFRIGQLLERTPKFVNAVFEQMGQQRWAPLDTCTAKSRFSWIWLTTWPRAYEMTPGVVRDVKDGYAAWSDKTSTREQNRFKVARAFREGTDLVAMYSYSLANATSLFPRMSKLSANAVVFGDSITLAHDVTSLGINAQNISHARAFTNSSDFANATSAMKETIEGSKTYSWIATAKDVCAVVGGFFGLLFIASGLAVLPGVAAAAFSLGSTVFAVIRKLYEETLNFKPINFLDNKSVTEVIA